MGFDKIFANIGDITVIEYSINAFLECNSVNEVIVVINEKSVLIKMQKIKEKNNNTYYFIIYDFKKKEILDIIKN